MSTIKVAEQFQSYGKKRKKFYEDIILLLDKLPDAVVAHYRILLEAEIVIRNTKE